MRVVNVIVTNEEHTPLHTLRRLVLQPSARSSVTRAQGFSFAPTPRARRDSLQSLAGSESGKERAGEMEEKTKKQSFVFSVRWRSVVVANEAKKSEREKKKKKSESKKKGQTRRRSLSLSPSLFPIRHTYIFKCFSSSLQGTTTKIKAKSQRVSRGVLFGEQNQGFLVPLVAQSFFFPPSSLSLSTPN